MRLLLLLPSLALLTEMNLLEVESASRGTLFFRFLSYHNPSSMAAKGRPCDHAKIFWKIKRTSACDPVFNLCMGAKNGRCSVGRVETGYFKNQDTVYFGGQLGKRGPKNPVRFDFDHLPTRFTIRADVTDRDKFTDSEFIDTVVGTAADLSTSRTKVTLRHHTTLHAQVWLRCHGHYFGLGCSRINFCRRNPCKNRATCSNSQNGPKCSCKSGYRGNRCQQKINFCANHPCHRGSCVNQTHTFFCKCPKHFGGKRCEKVTNCPCVNGGQCKIFQSAVKCNCKAGFRGNFCQHRVNYCAAQPCVHGTCSNHIFSYKCKCQKYYGGRRCDKLVTCPCKNGGKCQHTKASRNKKKGHFVCSCSKNFYGKFCTKRVNFCRVKNPCRNKGVCYNTTNKGAKCHCTKHFGGDHCQRLIGCRGPKYEYMECGWWKGKPMFSYLITRFKLEKGKCVPHKEVENHHGVHHKFKCPPKVGHH